jgi:hypothetical protein
MFDFFYLYAAMFQKVAKTKNPLLTAGFQLETYWKTRSPSERLKAKICCFNPKNKPSIRIFFGL